jgi:O-antigen biosynthesis protein
MVGRFHLERKGLGLTPRSQVGVGPIEHDACPVRVLEVDLSEPLPSIAGTVGGRRYRRARILVRVERRPVGVVSVELDRGGMPAQALAEAISRDLARDPEEGPGSAGGQEGVEPARRFSVVVPTHDHPHRLRACIDSILAGEYPHYEVVVVDNAPRRPGTAALLRREYRGDARVRRVAEPRPGAARARATGLAAAQGEFVAFVDDDAVVDRMWLTAIAQAFSAAEDVAAVTTLILPRELETPAQVWLEQFGGYGKGFRRRVFHRHEGTSGDGLYPYSAGTYGSGASMAFRTRALRELGGFDSRLSIGGEDLDLFLKVILSGRRLVYEPAAIAWHMHPSDYESLRRTVFRYGAGLAALMTKWFFSDPVIARDIAVRLPAALRLALDPRSRKNMGKRHGYPRELTRLELAGMLAGPLMFAHSAWKARSQDAA